MFENLTREMLLSAPKAAPVCLTASLRARDVINAYPLGLFPWSSQPVSWWCPEPRMVLFPREVRKQRSLRRFFKRYSIKLDCDFTGLITLCARQRNNTWIDENFIKIYTQLFERKIAHSIECYEGETLVGGVYGLLMGGVFFGESMVSAAKNASKVALIALCELLGENGLVDCQMPSKHLFFMGARAISREFFFDLLKEKLGQKMDFVFSAKGVNFM